MKFITGRVAAVTMTTAAVFAFASVPAGASLAGQPLPLPANSVGSTQLKDGSTQLRDLSQETKFVLTHYTPPSSITTVQIRDKSIYFQDLSPQLQRLILQAGCAKTGR